MSWQDDPYWVAASKAALSAVASAELVFVPSEFLELHDRFVPLEYSWGIDPTEKHLAWCCSKDDVHRLAPWMHEWHTERKYCGWSNEVFVMCANRNWRRSASSASIGHWQAWREKVA